MWFKTNLRLNSRARWTAVSRSLASSAASTTGFLPCKYGSKASSFKSRFGRSGFLAFSSLSAALFFLSKSAQLRQAFLDAQDYAEKWADFERKNSALLGVVL